MKLYYGCTRYTQECQYLGYILGDDYVAPCRSWVQEEAPLIISMAAAELDPDTVCSAALGCQ